jgi:hypothetical protein
MADLYYFAAWTDSGRLLGCDHRHLTVVSAVVCAQSAGAGAFVAAAEDGIVRPLDEAEEREFQLAMYGTGVVRRRVRRIRALSALKPILS